MKKKICTIITVIMLLASALNLTAFAEANVSYWVNLAAWFNAKDVAEDLTKPISREEAGLVASYTLKKMCILPSNKVCSFTDQKKFASKEAITMIEKLSATGIICGYPDETFKPEAKITRAEFAKIASSFASYTDSFTKKMQAKQFNDVDEMHWAYTYIQEAAMAGLMQGYNGYFRPDDSITREEVITVYVNILGLSNNPLIYAVDKLYDLSFENEYEESIEEVKTESKTERPIVDLQKFNDNSGSTNSSKKPERPVVNVNASNESTRKSVDIASDNNAASVRPSRPVVDITNTTEGKVEVSDSETTTRPSRPVVDITNTTEGKVEVSGAETTSRPSRPTV